jgi:putative ABC transport system substrate-binding protein
LVGPNPVNPVAKAFVQGLRDLGYVDGENIVIEWRSAEGKLDNLEKIVRQLVADHVDVIVATVNPVTKAAKNVTTTVPIVMAGKCYPGRVELRGKPTQAGWQHYGADDRHQLRNFRKARTNCPGALS